MSFNLKYIFSKTPVKNFNSLQTFKAHDLCLKTYLLVCDSEFSIPSLNLNLNLGEI